MKVGEALISCTKSVDHRIVEEFKSSSTTGTGKREKHSVVLVDTPGFNRKDEPDSAALEAIGQWAQKQSVEWIYPHPHSWQDTKSLQTHLS